MGGIDKGLVQYAELPMAQHVANTLRPFVEVLWINSATNHSAYMNFCDAQCADLIHGQPGPLAGLHSLLSHSKADYVLISPCDTPLLEASYPQRMLASLSRFDVLPKAMGVQTHGAYHGLHCCLATSLAPSLERFLANKRFKVQDWLESAGVCWVDFSDCAHQFDNINFPHQLS